MNENHYNSLYYGIGALIMFALSIISGLKIIETSTSLTGLLMMFTGMISIMGLRKARSEPKSQKRTIGFILNLTFVIIIGLAVIGSIFYAYKLKHPT